ncbi:MAG: hypothetical protein E6I26_14885 [Chloroflexi bacterium]|nr:MAG: hypothetical protein E6I26_14885 [Chloroflexota bacterium]
MTEPVRVPSVVEALIRAVAGGSEEERDQRASTFARGLALGALVGAAIAGSTIWQRRLAKRSGNRATISTDRSEAPR